MLQRPRVNRLQDQGRFPINIWGDVLLDGSPPAIRRVLAGQDAHECMYTWVYFSEILSLQEMQQGAIRNGSPGTGGSDSLFDRFKTIRSYSSDPQRQITDEVLRIFAPLAITVAALGETNTEFCELGSTMYASIDKLALAALALDLPLVSDNIRFTAVERSALMNRTAKLLHGDADLNIVTDLKQWRPTRPAPLLLSRFVASYTFQRQRDLIEWLSPCEALTITDVFELKDPAFHTWDLGLPMTFFGLNEIIDELINAGWQVYLTDLHPDYNASGKRKCAVARLYAIKEKAAARCNLAARLTDHPQIAPLFGDGPLSRGDGRRRITAMLENISEARWQEIVTYKEVFPIWGRVPENSTYIEQQCTAKNTAGLNLHFAGTHIEAVVNQHLRQLGKAERE